MRFVDHILDDQIVDHMTLKVILPEGAEVVKLVTPYDVKRREQKKHFTYLDTVGRPVVEASKDDLVEGHIQDFEVIKKNCYHSSIRCLSDNYFLLDYTELFPFI